MCVCAPVQIEQVSQLSSLVESQLQYHRQAVQILDELSDKLRDRCVCEHVSLHSMCVCSGFCQKKQ